MDENQPRILWVDDDPVMRRVVELVATDLGIPVQTARDIEAAREHLAGEVFDWIVCDYWLAGRASAPFVHEMVEQGRRVAVLTGDVASVDRALAVPVFEKPIFLQDLVQKLHDAPSPAQRGA